MRELTAGRVDHVELELRPTLDLRDGLHGIVPTEVPIVQRPNDHDPDLYSPDRSMTRADPMANRPALEGLRVVSFEVAAAGPFATLLLADMGAEVIKVERPSGGDSIRGWDNVVRGLSSGFVWLNRRKRSVQLDVTTPGGREAMCRLI